MAVDLTLAIGLIVIGSHLAIFEVVTSMQNLINSGWNALAIRAAGVALLAVGFWLMYPSGNNSGL